ncbi:MAG: TIM barrel protein, partial [Planctomycetota bacterium]
LWPRVHGSQREQVDEMGMAQFQSMCDEYDVRVACLSQYKLGAFGLADEIVVASQLDCPRIVVHAGGRPGKTWPETRDAIKRFVAQSQKTIELAGEHKVRIVVENHGSTMLDSFDAIDCFLDHIEHPNLRLALAPAHLSSRSESSELAESVARLIHRAGPRLDLFYAWQHGDGFRKALPMTRQRQQLPGTGPLDFAPAMKALAATRFTGVIEVMMHPTPRGIPIAPSITGVTDAIDQSHQYLRKCLSS